MTRPLTLLPRGRFRAPVALAALALAALATAGPAAASPGSGELSLSFKPEGKNSLLGLGVTVSSSKAKGASARSNRGSGAQTLRLAVDDIELAPVLSVRPAAGITLSAAGKQAVLADLVLQGGSKGSSLGAKLAGKRQTFFRLEKSPRVDGLAVKLGNAKLQLTAAGAKALREKLGLEQLASGRTGSAGLDAALDPIPTLLLEQPKQEPTGGGGSSDPTPEPKPDPDPSGEPDPFAAQCNVPAGTAGAFGNPPGKVSGFAPTPTFDAGQPVTGTEIEWGFKDSLRGYVLNVPPSGSLHGLDGATTGPNMSATDAFFGFPVGAGTYEAGGQPDHADDKLVAEGTGTVLFCKPGHGFDVVLRNPTVTIDGASSRITADIGANLGGTWYPFQRVDVADLDLSGIEPTLSDGGNTLVWEDVPATLTADGATATGLGGFYSGGEELDSVTVKTSVDRALLSECTIASGTGTLPRPGVDFTLAPVPTLSSPVSGSGGTIDWGFRRATRNTVVLGGGAFTVKGGASEGFPGNMGGGNAAPPSGGLQKFFRFPISHYDYEEGTVDPGDDRLVASSDATVGFCNPNAGNLGLILAKPTLVVDGANSRLVANAYSFMGGQGWIGGRVDLVDLDTSGVDAVTGTGTVNWGETPPDDTPLTTGIPVLGALQTEALSLAGLTPASTASGGWDPVSAQIELGS
ncbi:MAG: HtaA domain-containing protein [Solirubrobacterales bacterium]